MWRKEGGGRGLEEPERGSCAMVGGAKLFEVGVGEVFVDVGGRREIGSRGLLIDGFEMAGTVLSNASWHV